MHTLNYQHLQYFWTVARLGSITKAAEELMLAPPTIHAQIRTLESQLGVKLFERKGRGLVLTEIGQVVRKYADGIFALGREVIDAVRHDPINQPLRLVVGVVEAVPKVLVRELLRPVLEMGHAVRLICREGSDDALLADLAGHRLDVVLVDRSPRVTGGIRVVSHLLGECGISFVASPEMALRLRGGFPGSLDGAPALLPSDHTAMRSTLDRWFESVGVRPHVVAEFDDTALIKVFGSDGLGFFPVHNIITEQICRRYGVQPIGRIDERSERFYAITTDRKLKHPAVRALAAAARSEIFALS